MIKRDFMWKELITILNSWYMHRRLVLRGHFDFIQQLISGSQDFVLFFFLQQQQQQQQPFLQKKRQRLEF